MTKSMGRVERPRPLPPPHNFVTSPQTPICHQYKVASVNTASHRMKTPATQTRRRGAFSQSSYYVHDTDTGMLRHEDVTVMHVHVRTPGKGCVQSVQHSGLYYCCGKCYRELQLTRTLSGRSHRSQTEPQRAAMTDHLHHGRDGKKRSV